MIVIERPQAFYSFIHVLPRMEKPYIFHLKSQILNNSWPNSYGFVLIEEVTY